MSETIHQSEEFERRSRSNGQWTWHYHRASSDDGHDGVIYELQRMRGRVLYAEGRRPAFKGRDGTLCDVTALDPLCHHVFVRANGPIIGCCRLLPPDPDTTGSIEEERGTYFFNKVLKEIGAPRKDVGEASRWIVAPEYAGWSLGLRLIAGVWAVASTTRVPIYVAMAGTRSAQATALIRTGARPLTSLGPIVSKKYDDELQVLFFETAKPAARFIPLIEKMRAELDLAK